MKISTTTMEAVWRFFKRLRIEFPYEPIILLQGIYPKEHKT
jgi:hypothetical protein